MMQLQKVELSPIKSVKFTMKYIHKDNQHHAGELNARKEAVIRSNIRDNC